MPNACPRRWLKRSLELLKVNVLNATKEAKSCKTEAVPVVLGKRIEPLPGALDPDVQEVGVLTQHGREFRSELDDLLVAGRAHYAGVLPNLNREINQGDQNRDAAYGLT
jgi:hypothetical protein